jgi:hypothetical protein
MTPPVDLLGADADTETGAMARDDDSSAIERRVRLAQMGTREQSEVGSAVNLEQSKKYRDVQRTRRAAIVIDVLASTNRWRLTWGRAAKEAHLEPWRRLHGQARCRARDHRAAVISR